MELKDGKYFFTEGEIRKSLFLKIYAKKFLIIFTVIMGIIIELFVFDFFPIEISFFIKVLYYCYCLSLYFLIWENYYYNKKYPDKRNLDNYFVLFALFFGIVNFILPSFPCVEEYSFRLYDIRINMFNLLIGIILLFLFFIKLGFYLIKRRKGEDKRPLLIFYLSSALTVALNSISFFSLLKYVFSLTYIFHFLVSVSILVLYLAKTLASKFRKKQKRVFGKKKRYMTLTFIFIFIILSLFYILRLIWMILNKDLIVIQSIPFQNLYEIWSPQFFFIFIILSILSNVFLVFIRYILTKKVFFDWEEEILSD